MENHHFQWVNQLFLAIFHSSVNLYQRFIDLSEWQKMTGLANVAEGLVVDDLDGDPALQTFEALGHFPPKNK